jgi:hypothetical protein
MVLLFGLCPCAGSSAEGCAMRRERVVLILEIEKCVLVIKLLYFSLDTNNTSEAGTSAEVNNIDSQPDT